MTMQHPDSMQKLTRAVFIATTLLLIIAGTAWGIRLHTMVRSQPTVQPTVDIAIGGFPMAGNPAPDFTLTDQFGQSVTFSSLRGREVVLAFIDSKCTDVCPLTAELLLNAKTQLGPSIASKIALVAINANPTVTSVADVRDWSTKHGMLHQWLFLTGTAQQLRSVYTTYHVLVQVTGTQVVHDSATLIIDPQGRQRLYFETLNSKNPTDLRDEELGLVAGMRQWLP